MIEVHCEVLGGLPHWTIPPFDENEDVVKLSFGTADFAEVSERDAFEIIKDAVRRVQYQWVQPSLGTWKLDLSALADFMVQHQRPDLAWLRGTIAAKPEFKHENSFSDGTRVGTAEFIFYVTAEAISEAASGKHSASIAKRNLVFISYSHADEKWLRRLLLHLRPLERRKLVELFDDTKIKPGSRWRDEIQAALDRAKVAILLISADFLASEFIANDELPPLLKKAESGGATIIPVIVSPCRFLREKNLCCFQSVNPPSRDLERLTRSESEQILTELTDAVETALGGSEGEPQTTPPKGPEQIEELQNARPESQAAKELLQLIEKESNAESKGLVEILDSPEPGYTFFLPGLRDAGSPSKLKSRLFREAVEELVAGRWLYPPEDAGKTRVYEFRATETRNG